MERIERLKENSDEENKMSEDIRNFMVSVVGFQSDLVAEFDLNMVVLLKST